MTLEIENLTHERRSKELVKHYLTSLAIEEILLLRLAETLSVIVFSAKSYYSQRWAGSLMLVETKLSTTEGVLFGSMFQNLKIFVTFDPSSATFNILSLD